MTQELIGMNIEVILDSNASDSEIEAVKAVLREEGIHGSVEASLGGRGQGEFPWVIMLLMPVASFLHGFASAFGKEAGRDAYQALRRWVSRFFAARRNSNGNVVLLDDDTATTIVFSADLPKEAYEQLTQKNLEQLKGGYWTWDSNLEKWERM